MPSRSYTIETRIPGNTELACYLDAYVAEYNAVAREMWHDMTSPDFSGKYPKPAAYVTHICDKHRLLKRTVNSIRNEVRGRMKALMELKKTELCQTDIKISVKEEKIAAIKKKLDQLKKKAKAGTLSDRELKSYQGLKAGLYWQKNKLNKLRQRQKKLEYQIDNGIYDMCYGTKAMFRKQFRLAENGYKTHEKWHNDFIKARDKNIFYLGSSDEAFGNQMCRLKYDRGSDRFALEVRREYRYCTGSRVCDKYTVIHGLDFKYMKEELIRILQSYDRAGKGGCPLSYRFHRVGRRWYLQVMFRQTFEGYLSSSGYGTLGLDYNDGFIEMSETDESGNLVKQAHYDLRYHGTGKKAETEIRDVVADIMAYAAERGKDVVIEDLDFKRTKAKQSASTKRKGKRYNRMLHVFDYRRYKETLKNTGFNHRINVVMINPCYTSRIGKRKYCGSKKLNVHQAASYVIARRGQGFIDKLSV